MLHGFVKFDKWILLGCYMDLSNLLNGFVKIGIHRFRKVVTWICPIFSMYFLPLKMLFVTWQFWGNFIFSHIFFLSGRVSMVDVSNAILARLYCLVGRWQLDCIVCQPTLIDEEDTPILSVNRTCVIIRYEGFQGLKTGPRCSNECEDKFLFLFAKA